jgi:hypothetical protein
VFLVKELVRFLVAHSIISKVTVKTLIGWFLYIPLVIVPIIVISVLIFVSRKINARAINILNLIFASGAALMTLMAVSGCRWAGSPPPSPHYPLNGRELIAGLIVISWLAGAVGLFFRKRLAWVGSVIGVGSSVSFFDAGLVVAIAVYFYPDAELNRVKEFGMNGYIFAFVYMFTVFSILLAVCLRLLLGLFQMRKEIFAAS